MELAGRGRSYCRCFRGMSSAVMMVEDLHLQVIVPCPHTNSTGSEGFAALGPGIQSAALFVPSRTRQIRQYSL